MKKETTIAKRKSYKVTIRHKRCNTCGNDLPAANFRKDKSDRTGLMGRCKDCQNEKEVLRGEQFRKNSGVTHKECGYCGEVKPVSEFSFAKSGDGYDRRCKACVVDRVRRFKKSFVKFSKKIVKRFAPFHEIRKDEEGYATIQCTNSKCGEWTRFTKGQMDHRISSIEGTIRGDNNIYCGANCQETCSIFGRKSKSADEPIVLRVPMDSWLVSEVYKRFGGKCAVCGASEDLKIHHIVPVAKDQMIQLDISNLELLCHFHHMERHRESGMSFYELRSDASCQRKQYNVEEFYAERSTPLTEEERLERLLEQPNYRRENDQIEKFCGFCNEWHLLTKEFYHYDKHSNKFYSLCKKEKNAKLRKNRPSRAKK